MDREKRKAGENYLKKWGQSILDMENLQREINQIRRNNDVFDTIQMDSKQDIINIYNIIVDEKLLKLKNIMYDYKFIGDRVSD